MFVVDEQADVEVAEGEEVDMGSGSDARSTGAGGQDPASRSTVEALSAPLG